MQAQPKKVVKFSTTLKDSLGGVELLYSKVNEGASEASAKWVGITKNHSTGSKKWMGTRPFSIKIKQKSGWARAHPAHPAPTPLY